MIQPGEIRTFKKASSTKAYGGDIVVLEVHDEPRVEWTDKQTCLVRQGKQKPNVMTVESLEEKSVPA